MTTAKVDIDRILVDCLLDTGVFGRTAFPEVFFAQVNNFHRQIYDAIDAVDADGRPLNRKVVIAAPRGLGKTNCVALGYAAKRIVYRTAQYIMYVTASSQVAIEKTENLKQELLRSEFVREKFGSIKTRICEDFDPQFSKESYYATLPVDDPSTSRYRGTKVVPRGANQQVRGRGSGGARPDVIIGDDLDDPKYLANEMLRDNARKWWFGDVMGCVSRYDPGWQIVYIGTMTHPDCLLRRLMDLPDWTVVNLDVCTDDFQTLCPEYMSQDELNRLVEEYTLAGMLDVFYREFRNKEGDRSSRLFLEEHFNHYDEGELALDKLRGLRNIVIIDPAKTANPRSADTAIVGVGIDFQRGTVYVRDTVADKFFPDEWHRAAIEMITSLKANVVGIETTGLNEHVLWPFENALAMAGVGAQVIELKARSGQGEFAGPGGGKDARVSSLLPLYRRGVVFHNRSRCQKLEKELLNYRTGLGQRRGLVDLPDALGYVPQMLASGEQFFADQRLRDMTPADRRRRFELEMNRLRRRPGPVIHRELAAGVN